MTGDGGDGRGNPGGGSGREARLRSRARLPVAAGFGISRPKHAREVASVADGVVVGSALVTALGRDEEAFADLAAALAEATHGANQDDGASGTGR